MKLLAPFNFQRFVALRNPSTVCNWPLVGHKSGFLPLTRLTQVISSKTLKNESLKSGSNREGTSYQKTGFFSG